MPSASRNASVTSFCTSTSRKGPNGRGLPRPKTSAKKLAAPCGSFECTMVWLSLIVMRTKSSRGSSAAPQVRGSGLLGNIHRDPDRGDAGAVLGPVRGLLAFGQALAGLHHPRRLAFLVIGHLALQDVAHCRTVLVAVQADHAAGEQQDAAHTQWPALDRLDLVGEVKRAQVVGADALAFGGRLHLPDRDAGGEAERERGSREQRNFGANELHRFSVDGHVG